MRDIIHISSPHVEHRKISDEEMFRIHIMHKTVVSSDGCWEWQGTTSWGYGTLMRSRKRLRAHCVAHELWNGPIPKGHIVRHKCDNPKCVNPSHLVTGTQADNIKDCVLRWRTGKNKLSKEDIVSIRRSRESNRSLADAYGVGIISIRRARSGETFRHVPGHAANLSERG